MLGKLGKSTQYFDISVDDIKNLESFLTMVGGNVVYGAGAYESIAQAAPPVRQDWLPMKDYGRYCKRAGMDMPPRTNTVRPGHQYPVIIGDASSWTMECPCAL